MSFVETEKDKKEDLVRENAKVKCSCAGDEEIEIIFPPWGIVGGENGDIKQMLDVYTDKATCFSRVFESCDSKLAVDKKCAFSVFNLWQRVGTFKYVNTSVSDIRNLHIHLLAIDNGFKELSNMVDKGNILFLNPNNNSEGLGATTTTYYSHLISEAIVENISDDSSKGQEYINLSQSMVDNIQSYLPTGESVNKTIGDIEINIKLAKNIIDKTTSQLPNINDNPSAGGFPLKMWSELPCFKLGYLYFKENGEIEIEEPEHPYIDIPQDGDVGTMMTFMGYHMITNPNSTSGGLKEDANKSGKYSIDETKHYAMIDGRILIATKANIGGNFKVAMGDYLDVTFQHSDGTISVYKCIAGDEKGADAPNSWGHQEGKCVTEIIYHDYDPPAGMVIDNNPWGPGRTIKIEKVGSYYD